MPEQIPTPESVKAVNAPSLFRRLLAGALIGLSGVPEQGDFAAGLAGGAKAVQQHEDRELKNLTLADAVENDNKRLALDERRLALDEQENIRRGRVAEAQIAQTLVEKLRIEQAMQFAPKEHRANLANAWSKLLSEMQQSGAQVIGAMKDDDESRTSFLEKVRLEGGKVTDYLFIPSIYSDEIVVFKGGNNANRALTPQKGLRLPLPSGKMITIEGGLPWSMADQIYTSAANAELQKTLVQMRESAETPKPLTLKDALAQARQEIAPLVSAQSLLPESSREFKTQVDIERAINRRAHELLSLDQQLRRGGSKNASDLTMLISELEGARKRGATNRDLAQAIVAARANGLIQTEEEARAIFAKLRIDPLVVFGAASPEKPGPIESGLKVVGDMVKQNLGSLMPKKPTL